MIRIAIVDDEEIMQDIIYQKIEQSVNDDEQIEISRYSSSETFMIEIQKGEKFDILCTDIQMKKMSGIDLGRKIRESQPNLYIIFVTSYTEYAAESYAIEAYQYILKQDLDFRLPIVIKQLIDKINHDSKQYRIMRTDTGKEKVYYKDIEAIYKSKGKYVYFLTTDGEYRERTTLQQVFQELASKEFLMVERGYIVNMKHISRVSGDTIYMENDYHVKISRAKLADIKKKINCYWGK